MHPANQQCSNYRAIALISQASKVMHKILMWTKKDQMYKLDLEKAEEIGIKLSKAVGS